MIHINNFKSLSLFEYIIFIHSVQLSAGILTMPRSLANTAGTDGWISIILGWIMTSIIGVLIIKVLQKNSEKQFPQILTNYFGKWFGTIFIFFYSLFLLCAGLNTLLKATQIVQVWIFPSKPSYQIVILMLIPFCILISNGIRAITNYSILVFFFTAWMPIIFLFSLKSSYNPLQLFPIIKDGLYPIIKATKDTITPYAGLELAYFIYPFLHNKEKAVKGILIANSGTMVLYLYTTILSYIYFSPEGIKKIAWPIFNLLKGINFSFIERFEIIYIVYYLVVFSTTIYSYFSFSIYLGSALFNKLLHNWLHISFLFLILGLFILFNPDASQILFIYNLMDVLNIIFLILLPSFFFAYSIFFTWLARRRNL
ncbi:GerAB/ArcD/ProY family transporter [Bacillus thuringiensis]|uniref:GerAB/ArcD/ProY family transporter n=1 Tax=Bacillus thuringiensis TaxID=1428 RepID=UPI0005B746F5|nr:GerAB/ArcD/ProY family transporter [Bacillus thuringiensis]KIP27417.1 spore germination family protein [Bacillus thuringiensis serovar morrisoni]MCT6946964.1 spore germination protein [Bacillus thuringiensis]MDR4150717.1 GerAB/ArcD/ProY family transporter [Bacillus thuringiensis]MEC3572218.1 GerAB/ArcD/ProY family transporter [Bacillus thuringiensis]MED2017918.1 GerAB/ArcD/ProY family transporter [Bacillus thuringiensis]